MKTTAILALVVATAFLFLFIFFITGLSEIPNYGVVEDWLSYPAMIPHVRVALKDKKITKHEYRKLAKIRNGIKLTKSDFYKRQMMRSLFR